MWSLPLAEYEELQTKLFARELDLSYHYTLSTQLSKTLRIQTLLPGSALLLVSSRHLDTIPFNRFIYERKLEEAEKWLSQQNWYSYTS